MWHRLKKEFGTLRLINMIVKISAAGAFLDPRNLRTQIRNPARPHFLHVERRCKTHLASQRKATNARKNAVNGSDWISQREP